MSESRSSSAFRSRWSSGRVPRKKSSTIHWSDSETISSTTGGEDSVTDEELNRFCCHDACSFTYNVQEGCLKRESFVMESVPFPTYLKLAPLFGMDPHKTGRSDGSNRCKMTWNAEKESKDVDDFIHLVRTEIGIRSNASTDEEVEVATPRNSVRDDPSLRGPVSENPYLSYTKCGVGDESAKRQTLGRKSKQITRTIIREFLEWYQSIGGEDEETTIDESILQDLFQVGCDSPTARAIALRIKEMPVVPESLATLRNEPEFAVTTALKTFVKMDIRLEEKSPRLFAFGTMLPKEEPCLRFHPPKNNIKKAWTECQRVPPELESLKVVWDGIENLRSTIAFSNWLKQHPEIPPPGYLKEKGLLDINYEEWMQKFKGFEKEMESEGKEADGRLKELAENGSQAQQRKSLKSVRTDELLYGPSSAYSMNWNN